MWILSYLTVHDLIVSSIKNYRSIEKTAWNNNTLTKRQRYIYNGYVQIAEIDATNEDAPQVVKTYLWDPSEPVATRVLHMTVWNNGTEVESLYYTHDLQKNVTALFGQAAGRRAQYEHDPYGNPINTTGDAAGINPYRYSSEYLDEDLGLIYYNYRHYNPTDGRWINRDPIAEQGGINLYGFVRNKVTLYCDYLGQYVDWDNVNDVMEFLDRTPTTDLKCYGMCSIRSTLYTGWTENAGGWYERR